MTQVTTEPAGIGLLDLTDRTCRWPIGDPMDTGFHFCGAAVAVEGDRRFVYCEAHRRRAYYANTTNRAAAEA